MTRRQFKTVAKSYLAGPSRQPTDRHVSLAHWVSNSAASFPVLRSIFWRLRGTLLVPETTTLFGIGMSIRF